MASKKRYRVGIAGILDSWNPEVDIDDYRVGADGRLEVAYFLDDRITDRLRPDVIAGWFGGRFVKWAYDDKGSIDGMIIEREVE